MAFILIVQYVAKCSLHWAFRCVYAFRQCNAADVYEYYKVLSTRVRSLHVLGTDFAGHLVAATRLLMCVSSFVANALKI